MNTLYDVLDVPPNSDAPKIKDAFRKAVKLSHPDLNVDDPEAAARLRLIVRAKTILSDPELRAVYDRMLEFERQQLHPRSKLLTVRDAMHVVILAAVIAGAFTLFANSSQAPFGQVKVTKDPRMNPSISPMADRRQQIERAGATSPKVPQSLRRALLQPRAVPLSTQLRY